MEASQGIKPKSYDPNHRAEELVPLSARERERKERERGALPPDICAQSYLLTIIQLRLHHIHPPHPTSLSDWKSARGAEERAWSPLLTRLRSFDSHTGSQSLFSLILRLPTTLS